MPRGEAQCFTVLSTIGSNLHESTTVSDVYYHMEVAFVELCNPSYCRVLPLGSSPADPPRTRASNETPLTPRLAKRMADILPVEEFVGQFVINERKHTISFCIDICDRFSRFSTDNRGVFVQGSFPELEDIAGPIPVIAPTIPMLSPTNIAASITSRSTGMPGLAQPDSRINNRDPLECKPIIDDKVAEDGCGPLSAVVCRTLRVLACMGHNLANQLRSRSNLERSLKKTQGLLTLLREASTNIDSEVSPEKPLRKFISIARDLINCTEMVVYLVELTSTQRRRLIPITADDDTLSPCEMVAENDVHCSTPESLESNEQHYDGSLRKNATIDIDEGDPGFLASLLKNKRCMIINNVSEYQSNASSRVRKSDILFNDRRIRAVMGHPLLDRDEIPVALVVGLRLALNSAEDDVSKLVLNDNNLVTTKGFSDHDGEILNACCTEVGIHLERHITDSLQRRATSGDLSAFSLMEEYLGRSFLSTSSEDRFISRLSEILPEEDESSSVKASISTRTTGTLNFSAWRAMSITSSVLEDLPSLDFDVFLHDDDDLCSLSMVMLTNLGALTASNSAPIKELISVIRENYSNENAFHNWKHAFSVMHMAYLFIIRHSDVRKALTKHQLLALMIAALGHDVAHPGNTNQFEINSESELALRFNNRSVLENHHAATLIRIMLSVSPSLLQTMDLSTKKMFKETVIDIILSTDMNRHIASSRRLSTCDDRRSLMAAHCTATDQNLLLETIAHASDLSAQGYNVKIAVQWEARISSEFRDQAKKEASLSLPVAPFMEGLDDPRHRAALQISFIDFVLRPYWKEVARLFPAVNECYHNIMLISRRYYILLHEEGETSANNFLDEQAGMQSDSLNANSNGSRHTVPTVRQKRSFSLSRLGRRPASFPSHEPDS